MVRISKLIIFLIFFLVPLLPVCQVIVSGKVFHNGKKLKGATISALSTVKLFSPTHSNSSGAFEIETDGKGDQLLISKKGYISQSVLIKNAGPIEISLEKAPRKKVKLFNKTRKGGCPPENPLCRCCFIRGTKILLNDGHEKDIEQIKPGDVILNTNLENFTVQTDLVYAIDSVIHNNLIEIELENKTMVTSTTDHPYFVEGKGWCSFDAQSTKANYGINAQELKIGDHCFVYSNGNLERAAITTIKQVEGTRMTYNISGLNNQSNYFANGIVVSNEKKVIKLTKK